MLFCKACLGKGATKLPGISKQITQHFDIFGLCSSQHPEIMKHLKIQTTLALRIRRERGQLSVLRNVPKITENLSFPLFYYTLNLCDFFSPNNVII